VRLLLSRFARSLVAEMSELRALLLTDVVDSTRIAEVIGDAANTAHWIAHDRAARQLLRTWRGREIERTDGLMAVFESAADAAAFAIDYHRALAALSLPFKARAGLHVGPVRLRESSAADVAVGAKRFEVDGLAIPIAARVMATAQGGQTLITGDARSALATTSLRVQSHGFWRLKGLQEPMELFEIGDVDAPFTPPPDADKAYRVVRHDDLWLPARSVRNNLPAERDAFVGRAADLRALSQRFDEGARLVTLLGPGGTGKTRLMIRYALASLGDWSGGVYFCDLSEARSLDGIYFAVAQALRVPLGAGDSVAHLGDALAGRGRCLVVLDNFEQVVEHAPVTVGRWLDAAAEAAFAVTSRERLQLPGEDVYPLEPLPLDKDAIDLFAARARSQRPDFAVDDNNRDAVAEVVRLLDGLPLAIELAAARVSLLSPAQLVVRMRNRFQLLAGVSGAAGRQATLRAAIDWSWHLLAPWEQAALAQCSVFDGGFTLLAAEAVLDLAAWADAPLAMDAVQALVDKSLLRRFVPTGTASRHELDEPYFGMYLSIHEYASEKFRQQGARTERAAHERHGRYFARFGTDEALEALAVRGGMRRHHALQLELDNLVAACRRAVARGDADVAVAAYRAAWEVLALQGPLGLGIALGEAVCAMDGLAESQREVARLTYTEALARVGGSTGLEAQLEHALRRVRAIGDSRLERRILSKLGTVCLWEGRVDEGRAHYAAALEMGRRAGDRLFEGKMSGNLAISYHEQGRTADALKHYETALAIWRELGCLRDEGVTLGNLADLLGEQGQTARAKSTFDSALAIAREIGDRDSEAIMLQGVGELQFGNQMFAEALETFRTSLRLTREMGNRRVEAHVQRSLGYALMETGAYDEARSMFEQVLASLSNAPNERLEGYALGGLGELLFRQGRIAEAADRLAQGEKLLRKLADKPMLARLLCARGLVDIGAGRRDAARVALADAQAIVTAMDVGPDSELGRKLAKLRRAVDVAVG